MIHLGSAIASAGTSNANVTRADSGNGKVTASGVAGAADLSTTSPM